MISLGRRGAGGGTRLTSTLRHLGVHRLPVGQHAVAVVAGDPVADEAGRGIEAELAGLQFAQLDLAEPGLEGLVADFLAQPVADAHPVRFKLLSARNFFHIGPRHCLLFVCCVLVVACYRRLNSVHSLSPRKSRCLPSPCRAALGLRIQGPLKAVRHIETCTVAGRGHGFRRRGRSSSTPTEKQQRRLLVGERARERGHEFRVGLHAGKDLPFEQRRLLGQRLEIGQADIVPFGARAHVDQDRVLALAQDLPGRRRRHVAGIAGGRGHFIRAGDLVVFRHGPRSSFCRSGTLNTSRRYYGDTQLDEGDEDSRCASLRGRCSASIVAVTG